MQILPVGPRLFGAERCAVSPDIRDTSTVALASRERPTPAEKLKRSVLPLKYREGGENFVRVPGLLGRSGFQRNVGRIRRDG
jgi:hypothetical protein